MFTEPDSGTQQLRGLLVGHASLVGVTISILALVERVDGRSRVLSHRGHRHLFQGHYAIRRLEHEAFVRAVDENS